MCAHKSILMLLRADGKGVRKRILAALAGKSEWSRAGIADIAALMLQVANDSLFAQLGYLAMVCMRLMFYFTTIVCCDFVRTFVCETPLKSQLLRACEYHGHGFCLSK